MSSDALVPLDAIERARDRLEGIARRTPIVPASSRGDWAHLRLKCENLQAAGAFKLRGAFTLLDRLPPDVRARGVVTYSSGNHGQAVAYAASRFGVRSVIVMPTTAPRVKVSGAKALGAEVRFAGTTTLERKAAAEILERVEGLVMAPPFDHPDVIAGQGTVGLEILEQAPDVSAIYVPVGGGGLIAGIAAAVKRVRPGVRIVGVEPAGAPKMTRSLEAGHPVTLDRVASIADGLLAVRPGDLTFAHVVALVDEVIRVSDEEIADAVRFLAVDTKLVAEPSGAASVAGARQVAPPGTAGVHVAVISGGNVEPAEFARLIGAQRA